MSNVIKVLLSGKHTQTRLRFHNGISEYTIGRIGGGHFLPGEFTEISEAKAFAEGELQRNPSAVFYIVSDNQILDEVMDQNYQSRRNKRIGIIYTLVSSAAVLIVSLCISLFVMPFNSTHAHIFFTGGMTLLYVAGLIVFGTRNIHALILIGIIIVMILFLTPSIQELLNPDKAPQTARPNVAEPQR